MLLLGLVVAAVRAEAQVSEATQTEESQTDAAQTEESPGPQIAPIDTEPPVFQYDLAGPRLGATILKDGTMRSQFGWHFENQAAPGTRGPWFLVEKIFLIGGAENNQFIPSATLVFGARLPSGFEFGVGPSATLSPMWSTAIVVAAGQSYRVGGIRVPVNVAVALSKTGQRVSIVTGWAIRESGHRERYRPRHRRSFGGGPGDY